MIEASGTTRVAIVMGAHWSGQMGGAQFQASQVVAALAKTGEFSVDYLARRIDPDFTANDHRVVQICRPVGLRRHTFAFDWIPLWQALDTAQPAVVYQRGLSAYTGVCAAYGRSQDVPFVFHVAHNNDVAIGEQVLGSTHGRLGFLDRRLGQYGLRRAAAVIAQTEDQATLLRSNFGIEPVTVIRNFHPEPLGKKVRSTLPKIVWIANWKKLKRPELFIDFASRLAERIDAEFVMLGRLNRDSREQIGTRRIGIASVLRIAGEVSLQRVEQELWSADLGVSTSLAEGLSNAWIQSWLRGVPMLSLGLDPDGFLSREGMGRVAKSIEELVENAYVLIQDRDLLERVSETVRCKARDFFNADNAGALVAVIRDMAHKRPALKEVPKAEC